MNYARLVVGALCSLPVGFVVACATSGDPSTPSAQTEGVGTVELAVSATGADGATYSIPTTNYIVAVQNGTVAACRQVATTPTQTFDLTNGTYQISIVPTCVVGAHFDGGVADAGPTASAFTLTRAADGGPTSVTALLTNPVQSVTVTTGSSSSVVFSFTVEQLGTIIMGTGTVTVAMQADASVTAPPTQGSLSGSFMPYSFVAGPSAIPSVTTLLIQPPSPPADTVAIGITSLSAFVPNENEQVCATFIPTVTQSGGTTSMTALFQELTAAGASGMICFGTPVGFANPVSLTLSRSGAATTAAFQSALSGGATDGGAPPTALFQASIPLSTSSIVYNGSSLPLAQFATPVLLQAFPPEFLSVSTTSGSVIGQLNVGASLSFVLAP